MRLIGRKGISYLEKKKLVGVKTREKLISQKKLLLSNNVPSINYLRAAFRIYLHSHLCELVITIDHVGYFFAASKLEL